MATPVLEKYQSKPFAGSSHMWAMHKLRSQPRSARVLDIGCGNGVLGKFLKEQGIEELYAVEPDAQAREHASGIYRGVASSIADFKGQKFDAVLLLDVLEHVIDHAGFLKETTELLSPGGTMLVSVPNVAHWSVRASLLCGFFEYTSRGILDRTHLSFFTRRSFRRLLEACPEMALTNIAASIEPVEFLLPEFIWDNAVFQFISRLRLGLAQFWPGLFAYQHLAQLRKSAQR